MMSIMSSINLTRVCLILLAMVNPSICGAYLNTVCKVIDHCVVDCSYKGFGPSAPELSKVVPGACQGQYLDEFLVDGNAIKSIPTQWLGGWRVRIINLLENSLSEIKPGAFSGTQCTLERLFMAENYELGYHGLNKDMFSGLECSLKRLNLDGCRLTSGDLHALEDLKYLDQLHLNRNSITHLPIGVFSKMKNLVKLYLMENGITIPYYEQPFTGLQSLSVLDLANNRLETVGYCSVGKLPVLNYLKLDGNHLVCNCSLWWLKTTPWTGDEELSGCLDTLSESGSCQDHPKLTDCSNQRPPGGDEMTDPDDRRDHGDKGGDSDSSGLSSTELAVVLTVVSLVTVAAIVAVVVVVIVCHRRKSNNSSNRNTDLTGDPTEHKVTMPSVVTDNQMRRLPTAPPRVEDRVISTTSSNVYELPPEPLPQGKSVDNSYSRLVSVPGSNGDGGADGYLDMNGALGLPKKY